MDNYAAFFKNIADILENSATFSFRHFGYLLCALAHEYFPKMRLRALEILTNCRGSKNAFSESLRSLYPLLGLDDEEHCASFGSRYSTPATKTTRISTHALVSDCSKPTASVAESTASGAPFASMGSAARPMA